jgi:uncharacterized protein YjcR
VARERSTNRSAALKLWLKSGRSLKLIEIAEELGVSDALIRKWKFQDKWDEIPTRRPRGAPKGNQNAVGNVGGGAPEGNQNAVKHGLYSKFLPQNEEFQELLAMVSELDPLDMLWQGVEIAFAKLLWAQRIMFVTDKEEMIKELKKQKFEVFNVGTSEDKKYEPIVTEEEHEFQFAWDRQFTDIKAYSAISREFRSAMKQFLSAAPENDERRAKLQLMQAQVKKVEAEVKVVDKGGNKEPLRIEIDYGDDES